MTACLPTGSLLNCSRIRISIIPSPSTRRAIIQRPILNYHGNLNCQTARPVHYPTLTFRPRSARLLRPEMRFICIPLTTYLEYKYLLISKRRCPANCNSDRHLSRLLMINPHSWQAFSFLWLCIHGRIALLFRLPPISSPDIFF